MIRALVLTSNKPRHIFYARTIASHFELVGLVSERKKGYYTAQKAESGLVQKHFDLLDEREKSYFPESTFPECESLFLSKEKINDPDVVAWAEKRKPDVIFLFGTGILDEQWLNAFPDRIINLHLGLSPFYRGSATMFWPYYNREYECLGTTIHLAVRKVDAGAILQRVKPELKLNEGYHDLVTRTVCESIQAMPGIAMRYLRGDLVPSEQELSLGVNYKKSDFTPEMLEEAWPRLTGGLNSQELAQANRSGKCDCSQ